MKVAQIVLNLNYGGLEKLVIQLSQKLNDQDHQSVIICLDEEGVLVQEARDKGVKVLCLNKTPGFRLKWVFELRKLLKSEKIQVVHSHNYGALVYGSLAAKLAGIPSINTRHSRTLERVSGWIWNLNQYIATVSHDTKEEILKHNRINKDKMKVIFNGVNLEEFNVVMTDEQIKKKKASIGLDEDAYVIGNIGRLVACKDQETLLKAFRKLHQKKFKGYLLIVGDGPLKKRLIEKAQQFGIIDQVKFLGFRDDVRELVSIFNVYVLSSIREGISLTLLEAMAASKPIVATSVGGNPEVVVDGKTGYLVPCGYPERIEAAIMRLFVNQNLAKKMGEEGNARAHQMFTLDKMVQEYIGLYELSMR